MIVLDASVAVFAFAHRDERGARARTALSTDTGWTVPEHWPVEVFSAIRGLTAGGSITVGTAAQALGRLRRAEVEKVQTEPLVPRMWALRHNLSAYDAPYVALAEARGLTLLTADAPLARAAIRYCRVELI